MSFGITNQNGVEKERLFMRKEIQYLIIGETFIYILQVEKKTFGKQVKDVYSS